MTATGGTDRPVRLLGPQEVADFLGVKVRWVYEEAKAGRLPHVRLGRYVRFRQESIDAWLEASERRASIRPSINRPDSVSALRGPRRRTGSDDAARRT